MSSPRTLKLNEFNYTIDDFKRRFRLRFSSPGYSVEEYTGYVYRTLQSIMICTPNTKFRVDRLAYPYRTEYQLRIINGEIEDVRSFLTSLDLVSISE
jgi:hypothetical protein